ncbi:MAG: TAT-variant-translocated molybdopterin oxidoreductase [Verrucomicrobia bacterium]|nr:TAT-variant-translocated molybdopterin oxidoreductase [Verrucomicrobiota bacterium]
MKRKVQHPEPAAGETTGRKYWRSLDELAATPGFQEHIEREFPEGASNLDGVDRRKFFKLMAASFALGGVGLAAGCRRPESYILPYGKSVEEIIPGLPLYFATAMPLRKSAIPLLAETHQGRPTKLEGNPSYLPHGSASSLLAQASILDLYDPDRATQHTIDGAVASVAEIQDKLAAIAKKHATEGGAGLAFLADESSSPTRAALVAKLKAKLPKAIWAEYEPIVDEAPVAAAKAAFGRAVKPVYRFAKAKRILSLDADFFHAESGSLYYAREFSKGRRVASKNDEMNRLYVAESHLTLSGSMADHRLRLASSHMLALAAAVACAITPEVHNVLKPYTQGVDLNQKWVDECAKDLLAHKGECLVVAGAHLPIEAHVIVHGLNWQLRNIGKTVDFVEVPTETVATINNVTLAIKAGSVKTLVVLGGNPAYNATVDLDWAALQGSVSEVVRYGYNVDETTSVKSAATTHIAAAHYLESWGDARTADGTIVPVQPMILPLFNGLTELEVLARILGETTTDSYTLVNQTITAIAGGDPVSAFRKFLHDGLLEGSAYRVVSVEFNRDTAMAVFGDVPKPVTFSKDALEVRFIADHKMDDGRFANNGWLQECPDPITKISWDNAILVSPRLGQELGIYPGGALLQVARVEEAEFKTGRENAYIGELTINGRTVRGPLHIQPGLANYTVVLPLGYGRTVSGRVGKKQGFSAYPVRTSAALNIATGATLSKTSERYQLANTQEHWSMEGRDIVIEANFDEYKENPAFVKAIGMESHTPKVLGEEGVRRPGETEQAFKQRIHGGATAGILPRGQSLYESPAFTGEHQWGMSIDLNTCTGCNACVVACQAENNIPIVGKDQVLRGREMHWIRLDRYYSDGNADGAAFGGEGNKQLPEDPQVSLQPVACAQCELAPCETVCPVNATVHDEEGLNAMAYNRCIGTRYCANNCPYKVRRFNFFDWNKRSLDSLYLGPLGPSGMPELVKMAKNPDVTVRMRGVMEKCTYCVQRIQQAKIAQKSKAGASDRVKIPDGTIKVACQQVCPVEAIAFGDITDPLSAVSKAKALEQDYALLGYLNVRPRTTYLGKLRNPNYAMPEFAGLSADKKLPFSRQEYNNKNHPAHSDEGHGQDSHGAGDKHAEPAQPQHGHSSLETFKNLGGLS